MKPFTIFCLLCTHSEVCKHNSPVSECVELKNLQKPGDTGCMCDDFCNEASQTRLYANRRHAFISHHVVQTHQKYICMLAFREVSNKGCVFGGTFSCTHQQTRDVAATVVV